MALVWRFMSICYHLHAFDAQRFADEVAKCSETIDICMLLEDCEVDEPYFGWSIDGTPDADFIGERVHPVRGSVSLVENVRSELDSTHVVPERTETSVLLGYVSEVDGRLAEEEPYVGYLMPDEIRRASMLLAKITLADDAGQDRDRLLLLRLFSIALESGCGLVWRWG
jgi:hypothetical protein